MQIQKAISEGSDILLKINKPGTGSVADLRGLLQQANITTENFDFYTPYAVEFKHNAERVVKSGAKVCRLDFDMPLNKENLEGIKKTITEAKEAGLQVIAIVKTPDNSFGIPNSEISFLTKEESLNDKLDFIVNNKTTLKDRITTVMSSLKEKTFSNEEKPTFKIK